MNKEFKVIIAPNKNSNNTLQPKNNFILNERCVKFENIQFNKQNKRDINRIIEFKIKETKNER